MKKKLLFNDFVIQYSHCNFTCEYCLNLLKPDETNIWRFTGQTHTSSDIERDIPFRYHGILKHNVNRTLENFQKAFDAPILRISGGEILGMDGIKELLEIVSSKYQLVQIITNGFYLDHNMSNFLNNLKNVHIHFSLDGHTNTLNYYRVKNGDIQKRLLDNLDYCVTIGLPVEISSVMTNCNTMEFETFLKYLMHYSGMIKVFPAPVRGSHSMQFLPTDKAVKKFCEIEDRYGQYSTILPPLAYISNLMDFMRTYMKRKQCFIPLVAVQSLDNGSVTACPNGWTSQIANLHFDNIEKIIENVNKNPIYHILTQERPRLQYCKECFTAYDVINLFFNNEITEDELRTIPLYSNDGIICRINEIKNIHGRDIC